MDDETKLGSETGEETESDTPPRDALEKRPLFDEEISNDIPENTGEKEREGNNVENVETPDEGSDGEIATAEEVKTGNDTFEEKTGEEKGDGEDALDMEEFESSGRKGFLKWVAIGAAGFAVVLAASFFIASRYIHEREKDLNGARVKISRKPVVTRQKKVVIKQYDMKPFFIRIPASRGGEDRFLSVRLTMEFIRKDLPRELETQRKLLRTLIYKQLKCAFEKGVPDRASEENFRRHIIPALNTFFKGGGVYSVGFRELEKR